MSDYSIHQVRPSHYEVRNKRGKVVGLFTSYATAVKLANRLYLQTENTQLKELNRELSCELEAIKEIIGARKVEVCDCKMCRGWEE